MLFGLAIGLIVALGVYLRVPPAGETRTRTATTTSPRTTPSRPAPTASQDENRFEFYEILPQLEVVVPESNEPARRRDRAQPPAPAAAPGSYLIQAGSFSAAADADRLQASLGLLGFESHVQRVRIDDAIFNRVRIGPIEDEAAAKRAQRRLRDAGIDSLLMQVPR
jgi:cell division protein FtsN